MVKPSKRNDKIHRRFSMRSNEGHAEISFRVKCVAVENERVFGDVIVTQQTPRYVPQITGFGDEVFPRFERPDRNQVHQILETPDFMALNRKRVNRHRCSVPAEDRRYQLLRRSKSADDKTNAILESGNNERLKSFEQPRKPKVFPVSRIEIPVDRERIVSTLVDKLLLDIYGQHGGDRGRSESESTVSSARLTPEHRFLQLTRLSAKNVTDLRILLETLQEHIDHVGGQLVRHLRKKDHLIAKRDKRYDVITAHLQARSEKRSEDTRMKFSVAPQPGESGFTQWLDAMKMVARLPGGIPPEFRKRLWLTLSERHLHQRGVDWRQAEKLCFNEWSNPDDEELGIQIVKDLHRTGCSLFCGAAGRDNQAVLRRVLLGFARWNKSVGYCQGLNVLAALILQVVDRAEAAAVKVMIYLIEGVLPEGYFADNLRGLSVDMAVFRDLLRMRLPKLSRHLEALQTDAKDKATGSSYEPPLTNVFTMQWFLTLFCHCLPQEAVLRVWDLIFLEGDEVLLRTALAIWEGLADRIMTVTSADEFYSIMGVLTREMLEFTDTNNLVKAIVDTGPLTGVTNLREKHRYNITPWARRLSDDDDTETEEDEHLAMAAAIFGMTQRGKKDREFNAASSLQTVAASNDRDRLALDISTLKQQYAKLRERQRQAHIILSGEVNDAACARQSMVTPATSQAMNHLLVGKSALVSGKGRQLGLSQAAVPSRARLVAPHSPRNPSRKDKQGVTLHWKDTKRRSDNTEMDSDEGTPPIAVTSTQEEMSTELPMSARPSASADSDSDSTSTELCDEPDRLSDVDSEEPTSTSDCYAMATDDEKSPRREHIQDPESSRNLRSARPGPTGSDAKSGHSDPATTSILERGLENADGTSSFQETSVAEITDKIRRLSADKEGPSSYDFDVRSTKTGMSRNESPRVGEGVLDRMTSENMNSRATEKPSTVSDSFDFLEGHDGSIERTGTMPAESDIRAVCRNEYDLFKNALGSPISQNINAVSEQLTDSVNIDSDGMVTDSDLKLTSNEKDSQTFLLVTPDLNVSDFDESSSNSRSKDESFVTSINSSNDASVSRSEMSITDRTHTVSYVVGHVPISPMTTQRKLTYATEYSSPTVAHEAIESVDPRAFKGAECDPRTSEDNDDPVVRIRQGNFNDESRGDGLQRQLSVTRPYAEKSHSPKTPGSSEKSFSSGETAGPDSRNSSLTVSPRTPVSLELREFHGEKSADSSVSSESKTLTLCSIVSDDSDGRAIAKGTRSLFAKTSPSSLSGRESIGGKSSLDPKLEASSSSDSCSPERKKSSERSFSSDLQSPVSANSIKFTSNCKRSQSTFSDSPVNLCSAVSPFYPISHPNQKTPSPYGSTKLKSSATDSAETSPEQKSTASSKTSTKQTSFKPQEDDAGKMDKEAEYKKDRAEDYRYGFVTTKSQMSDDDFDSIARRSRSVERDSAELYRDATDYLPKYRKDENTRDDESLDRYSEKDTVSPLPGEKKDVRCGFSDKIRSLPDAGRDKTKDAYIGRDYAKPFERSSSSVDKKFTDLKLSSSTNEFEANSSKKRSSDILEELRHLEAKTSTDGASEAGLLTKKSSGILEDLKSLEARRQDTFSDSVGGFSKGRLGDVGINIAIGERKTYVIEPKMELRKDSDSILNNLARSDNGEATDDKEPKLGVWTKVKPRKRSDNGRRSSERALKIIQENSAILHRILTCQAKKRLPDLEQISKNITISPINEEISKIFSPILEKIGLNEHEINEELARINFKDFDQMSVTSGSEFDAKINDELSKLSLIDDSEEIDHLDLDDALSRDYLDTREALIDRQINEELSKLLANYEEGSPTSSVGIHRQEECSSMQNASELEGLDLSSISTNVFSHKSSSDSIETKSDLGSIQEATIRPEMLYDYKDRPVAYPPPKYNLQDVSPKIDIDIYRELEKLDKISSGELFPRMSTATKPEVPSVDPYASESLDSFSEKTPSVMTYASKSENPFDSTPLRSPYDTYKPYDFKSRISPHQTPGSGYSARSYEKSSLESRFEFDEHKSSITAPRLSYDPSSERAIISKETLEFRVRYDEEPSPKNRSDEPASRPYHLDLTDVSKGAAYYETNTAVTPMKYLSAERPPRISEAEILSPIDYKYSKPDFYHRKYQDNSPKEYSYHQTKSDYQRTNPYALSSPAGDEDFAAQLSIRRRESHSLSPIHQSTSRKPPTAANTYLSKLSPSLEDVAKRPVSHPEFHDKLATAKFADHPNHGSDSYKKSSSSLGNIGHASRVPNISLEKTPSPKSQFNPFPVRNAARKPKELALKLGLYSPTSPGNDTLKRLH